MNREAEHAHPLRRGMHISTETQSSSRPAATFWVTTFVVALLIPIQIYLGGIRLSFYRFALLLAVVPIALRLTSSDPIRLHLTDTLIIAFSLTGAFSLFMTDASPAAIGIFIIESAVPYFLARAFIRGGLQFSSMARTLATCIIITIPFAFFENLTSNPIVLTVLGKVLPVLPNVPHEQRLGLDRAQVTFDHPILYGIFCAFGFALAIYATRPGPVSQQSVLRGTLVGLAAFLSLSSGALAAIGLQALLVAYDCLFRKFRRRWTILVIGLVATYVTVEAFSNRTVPQIAIPFLALNTGTAYTRLIVNEWALSGIMAHPWFGFGFTLNWPVPFWVVTTSIDNFWLAIAFRHGLPTMLLLLVTVTSLLLSVVSTQQSEPFTRACRTGFVITITAVCLAIVTVHLWNSTYVAFMFLLGSGMWMTEKQKNPPDEMRESGPPNPRRQASRFSRNLTPTYRRNRNRAE